MSDLISQIGNYPKPVQKNNITPVDLKPVENKKEHKSVKKETIIAGGALVAAAAAGVYLVMRGKAKKAQRLAAEAAAAEKAKLAAEELKKIQAQFEKFVKGKAVAKSGEPFSGEIIKVLDEKTGIKVVFNYENGILKQSSKFKGEDKLFEKLYNYDETGKLLDIEKLVNDGQEFIFMRSVNDKGHVITENTKSKICSANDKNELGIYFNDGTSKYYKDGKLRYKTMFNKKGKLIKLIYKEDGKTIESNSKYRFIERLKNSINSYIKNKNTSK